MTVKLVVPPQEVFYDANGTPLDGGFIYIGQADQNPETHPLAIYWDTGLTQPAAQPVRTVNGYPSNNGRAGTLYVAADYSMTIRNWARQLVATLTTSAGLAGGGGSTSSQVVDRFAGDGTTTAFILSTTTGFATTAVDVYVSGVHQASNTYTIVGKTLTFSEAPPAPPSGVATNIEVTVTEIIAVPIGTTGAAYVTYTPEGIGAVDRTVQDRLRDQAAAQDFGTLQQAVDTGRTVHFGPGTYTGTVTMPTSMSLEADATADLTGMTFGGPLRKGNRFTFGGDFESTNGYLAHPVEAPGSNQGNSWQNALAIYRGTKTNPDTTALYARTAAFIEMHSNKVHTVNQSVWGNPYKTPALTVEHWTYGTFEGEANGGAFRAYSATQPASSDPAKKTLVGISAIGQTNTGAGNDCWHVWGANFIAAQTSGINPGAVVGIEVDINHTIDATAGSGPSPGNNFTAYWAQTGAVGVYSTAAFFASRTTGSLGWNYVLYSKTRARDWMIYVDNDETATATASGIYAKINSTNGRVMRLDSGAETQFQVSVDSSDAISIRVNSELRKIVAGASDSGGTGFRLLRVAN